MSSIIIQHIARFIGMVLVQGLVFKQIALNVGSWFNLFIYPLFIFFLPMTLATPYLVLLGFAVGFAVDMFYGSWGVHASAGAFSGFVRPLVFAAFAPKGGYSNKEPIMAPVHFRWQMFMQVAATFYFFHLFWYFSVDEFTFVYFGTITLKTLSAWILSMLVVVLYAVIFNPKR
jgi:hypothetical protein